MQKNQPILSDQNIQHIFDSIDTGLVILDADKKIVFFNSFADRILKISSYDLNMCCYQVFSQRTEVCQECPLNDQTNEIERSKSYTIALEDGAKCLIKVTFEKIDNFTVCTVKDVTKEVTLIKKIDLSKKESQAKNILLERRNEKINEELDTVNSIIQNLPEALIRVDKNYEIEHANKAATEIFNSGNAKKCYELLALNEPCDLCPAAKGFDFAHGFKKRHRIGDHSYTELILRGSEGKNGLLLFSDTTRQIDLIEQIKNQQDTLTGVADVARKMQTEPDVTQVLTYFLSKVVPAFSSKSAILLVDDVRPGSVWITLPVEMSKSLVGQVTWSYLSRDIQSSDVSVVSPDCFPWDKKTVVSLIGGHGKRVGMLALDVEVSQDDQEKLELFADTVGAYIHNQLLMKQLEEKVNTDPLTNLYNRRYFEKAYIEETDKYEKYSIHFSIVTIDVNRLKKANDDFGHEFGDMLLKKVAELLVGTVRKSDIVARVGGDEFMVLMINSEQQCAEMLCRRIKEDVFDNVFLELPDKEKFPVNVSVGFAGSDICKIDEMVKIADQNMYKDKEEFYEKQEKYR